MKPKTIGSFWTAFLVAFLVYPFARLVNVALSIV